MINEKIKNNDDLASFTFDKASEEVQKTINHVLSTAPSIMRIYTEHLKLSRGKFIRAGALLTCAKRQDDSIHPDAVKMAAAVEILHLATLVHDDVIDDADMRRGEITLQKKYGRRTAVICGDYLLAAALKLAASISDKADYLKLNMPDYIGQVCAGEMYQHLNNGNVDLSVYQYLKTISGKTAALFEASFYAGAVFAKVCAADLNRYKRLGRYIGMIFQLTDDGIDFETSKDRAKKPVQSDFEQGVITLPLIHAFSQRKELKEKAKTNQLLRSTLNEAVLKTGGLVFTRMLSKKYFDKAIQLMDEIEMTEHKRSRLKAILNQASQVL